MEPHEGVLVVWRDVRRNFRRPSIEVVTPRTLRRALRVLSRAGGLQYWRVQGGVRIAVRDCPETLAAALSDDGVGSDAYVD